MPAAFIRERYQQLYADDAMKEHNLADYEAVLDFWEQNPDSCPRDATITRKDIFNMRDKVKGSTYKFARDDAESTDLWLRAHADCVIPIAPGVLYQKQITDADGKVIQVYCIHITMSLLD